MKLPDGVKVAVGGVTYKGEIPDHLCPEFLKPKQPTNETAVKSAAR